MDAKTIDDIVSYYSNLLIIQYHNKPKARATVELMVRTLLANGVIFDVRDAYNLDSAVGVQLDVIGKYVGIDRYYSGTDYSGFFAFTEYDEDPIDPDKCGFSEYANFDTIEGKWLTYSDVISVGLRLNDDDFRQLIKLRIAQNNSNHSHKSIDDTMFKFFGDAIIPDSDGHMIMYYFINGDLSQLASVAYEKGLFPRPMGVRLNYLIEQNDPFFGFSTYAGFSDMIEGFSTYADYDTKVGECLTYDKLLTP